MHNKVTHTTARLLDKQCDLAFFLVEINLVQSDLLSDSRGLFSIKRPDKLRNSQSLILTVKNKTAQF